MSVDFNTVSSTQSGSSTQKSSDKKNSMGKDDFLQLLVSELRNQDPLSPVDNKDSMAQLAQFSSLEQMTNIATAITGLSQLLTQQSEMTLFSQAASFIGKEVSWMDSDEKVQKGVVESIGWGDDGSIKLKVGDQWIDMYAVGIVSAPGTGGAGGTKDPDDTNPVD